VGFNPEGSPNPIPVNNRWRAFYQLVLPNSNGFQVGIGRSATLWRNVNTNQAGNYLDLRMNLAPPGGTVIQTGSLVEPPITGGPFDLPAMWYTRTGVSPQITGSANPSYVIAMGQNAQVHFLQECFGNEIRRIWAALVDSVDINLQCEFVELFPYAEFPVTDCPNYTANFPPIGTRRVFSYLPIGRQKPFQPSVPLGTLEPGSPQWNQLFQL